MKYVLKVTIIFSILCFQQASAWAETSENSVSEAHIKDYQQRLQLTPEQQLQITDLLTKSVKQRDRKLKKYGIVMNKKKKVKLNIKEKASLAYDLKKVGDTLELDAGDVLSDEQMLVWRDIQKQQRELFKQQLKKKLR